MEVANCKKNCGMLLAGMLFKLFTVGLILGAVTASYASVSPIVGAWQFGDGASNASGVLVFQANGTYFHAEDGDNSVEGPDGMERGTYSWNEGTGALTVSVDLDTNGEIGLSDPIGSFVCQVGGVALTITDGSGPTMLSRVYDAGSAIVGGWAIPGNAGVLVFLSNGAYFHAEEVEPEDVSTAATGMERGTYIWAQNGDLTVTQVVDTNGDYGLSDPLPGGFSVSVNDATIFSLTDGEEAGGTLERVSNSSVLPDWRLSKARNYMQTVAATQPTVVEFWDVWGLVETRNPGDATSVTISGGGISGSLAYDQESPGEWTVEADYLSKAALDAEFPSNSVYTITVSGGELGTISQSINIGPDTYPDVPYLTGTNFTDIGSIDPSEDFTIRWNGSSAHSSNLVVTSLPDEEGEEYFNGGIFFNGETEQVIPAQTLPADSTIYGYLEFSFSASDSDGSGGFGVSGFSGRHSILLDFELTTQDVGGALFWKPQGWVYVTWPYAYATADGTWRFFAASGNQLRVDLSTGIWGPFNQSSGWQYFSWPYTYSTDDATWYWHNAGATQWVVDLATGLWALLGE
jgi:hypothetical protein